MSRNYIIKRWFIFAIILCMFLISGCGGKEAELESPTEPYRPSESDIPTTNLEDEKSDVIETNPPKLGNYTLEDCKSTNGIYIAHEDGSFSRFYGGGFIEQSPMRNTTGMYLRDSFLDQNPAISKKDKLVLFCDSDYVFELLPVNWEIGVIYNELENGTRCYIYAQKHAYGVDFFTYYDNYETVQKNVLFVDGIAVNDYPFEIVQGGSKNNIGCGLPKGETVKIGYQNGSALVEEEYEVNATYFDCYVKRNTGGVSDDEYFLYPTPTSEGYAIIDIYDGLRDREVPSGKYVLVLRMGSKYIACLLNWENT